MSNLEDPVASLGTLNSLLSAEQVSFPQVYPRGEQMHRYIHDGIPLMLACISSSLPQDEEGASALVSKVSSLIQSDEPGVGLAAVKLTARLSQWQGPMQRPLTSEEVLSVSDYTHELWLP